MQQQGRFNRLLFPFWILFWLVWLAGIWFQPFAFQPDEHWYSLSRLPYQTVCHQEFAHSPIIDGRVFPVCYRCLSIYSFLFIGAVAAFFIQSPLKFSSRWILIGAGLMAFDFALNWFQIKQPGTFERLVTGGFFGFFTGLILTQHLFSDWKKNHV